MVVEKILERAARRAARAEVYYREYETTDVSFRAGRLHHVGTVNGRGVGLRVFAEGRVGFSSTNDLEHADELINAALATARHGRKADYELPDGAGPYPAVDAFDRATVDLTVEKMVAAGEEAAARLKAADPRLVVNVDIQRTVGKRRLANGAGFDRADEDTEYSFTVIVQRTTEDDIFFHYGYDASPRRDFDEAGIVSRLAEEVGWADKIVPVATGRMDLIFDSLEVPTLLLPVMTCVNGTSVVDRSSVLAGKRGEAVAAAAFTLWDDATSPLGTSAYAFDGEGLPARRTSVIEKGVLTSYLTDLATASELGVPPSANAQRGYRAVPAPGAANVFVAPGASARDELIAGTDLGILVLQTAGGSMGNLVGGELSATIGFGLNIENGEVVGRVKECLFAGNVFEMLGPRLRAVGRDVRRAEGRYIAPSIVVADQTVTSRA